MWTLPGKKEAPEIRSYKKDKVFSHGLMEKQGEKERRKACWGI